MAAGSYTHGQPPAPGWLQHGDGWAWCSSVVAHPSESVGCGTVAGCRGMCSVSEVCPEPSAKACEVGVGGSSGEPIGVVKAVIRLNSKCLCNPTSPQMAPCLCWRIGRKTVLAVSLISGDVTQHILKSLWTDLSPVFPGGLYTLPCFFCLC